MSQSNQTALENAITTDDLSPGGIMPRELFDQFYEQIQETAMLLGMVRTEPVSQASTRIPKLGVGERIRRGQPEGTEPAEYAGVTTDYVDIDCQKGSVYWDLTKEDLQNNPEGTSLADRILTLMANQFSVDTQELGIAGDASLADAFHGQNNGWLKIAADGLVHENGTNQSPMPVVSAGTDDGSGGVTPGALNTEVFNNVIMSMPDKYLERTNPVFMCNRKHLQAYRNELAGTESDAAFMMIMGSDDLTPFNYDIVAPALWPMDRMMFTDPQNLIYALQSEVDVSVVSDTDKTHELDLENRYAIHAQDDFAIEETQAGQLVTDLSNPLGV